MERNSVGDGRVMAPKFFVTHKWRFPKLMIVLFAIELPLTIGLLALFGIAQGDTYRTKLWQNGSDKGFNSNPNEVLYAYANYQPIHIPLLWSNFFTEWNVIVSVLSMFVMLAKCTMYIMQWFLPLLSVVVHAALVALYAVAIRNQSASDMSDPAHPSPGLAWYLSKGCSYAEPGKWTYCMQARASYALTIVMTALFITQLVLAIWSSIPTEEERKEREEDMEDGDIELKSARLPPVDGLTQEERWERDKQIYLSMQKTPRTPYSAHPYSAAPYSANPYSAYPDSTRPVLTPRTAAFTELNRGEAYGAVPKLSMPMPKPKTSSPTGPSRPLAFREQYGDTVTPPPASPQHPHAI